ncbi:MAG: protein translocase subunit SecD [Nitrospirota bacterium]
MKKGLRWRFSLIGAVVIFAIIFFLPSTPVFKAMPEWWGKNLPNRGITLGLDLQGGMHLVFEVDGEKAVDSAVERTASGIRQLLTEKKIRFTAIKRSGFTGIEITHPSESSTQIKKVVENNYPSLRIKDAGKSRLNLILADKESEKIKETATEQALETIRNRIDQFGVAEPVIHRQETNQIVVQLPGIKDPQRAIDLIGKTALLEFKLLDEESPVAAQLPASIPSGGEEKLLSEFKDRIPEGDEILFERVVDKETGRVSKRPYLAKKRAVLTGDVLTEARVNIDTRYNEPYVSVSFDSEGAKIFERVTGENVKKRMAIILDNNIYSAPVIQERIAGGHAQITGRFTENEAKDLAIVLRAGALPAPINMLQNVTVGPSLGQDSIDAGVKAGMIGAIAVILFMVIYYRLSGVIADFAVFLNVIILLGALAWFNATLTLPGIAGIILTIGMSVDANVLIFERIREELRLGKTVRAAIDAGYKKAFLTIVDSHVTTLITAAVLFQFGTGPIKGFAVTLSLGVMINLFTSMMGTRVVFDLITSKRALKRLSI